MTQFHEQQKLKIVDLNPAKYNPRKIGDWEMRKLMRTIDEDGFLVPIVVNKDMTIIAGHQRVEALKNNGEEFVMAYVLDVDKQREKELNLKLNRVGGEWDIELLTSELQALDEAGRMNSGFDENEIHRILGEELEKIAAHGSEKDDDWVGAKCGECGRKLPKSKERSEVGFEE